MSTLYPTNVARGTPFDPSGSILTSENVQDAIEETLTSAGSSRFAVVFGYNGNASSRYLELFSSNPSDQTPFVVAEIAEIASLSISCKTNTTATVSIRKNGVEITTISLTSAKVGSVSGLSISLVANDTLSAYVSIGSVNDPAVAVNIKVA